MTTEKADIVLPHYLMPSNTAEEFWIDAENWRSACPFPFGNISDLQVARFFKAMVDYSQDSKGGSNAVAVIKSPIGLDIAAILLARVPDLFRNAWAPILQKLHGGQVEHRMAGITLQIPGEKYTNSMRFMVGLAEGKYMPVTLRGGIAHGCKDGPDKAKQAFDEKRKADYTKYQEYAGLEIGLVKRSVSTSYRRTDPSTVKEKLENASTDEEKMEIKRDAYMTAYEICLDLQTRRVAAVINTAEREKLSPNGVISVDQSKNCVLFPLTEQKSVAGMDRLCDMQEWQTTRYGYMQWDVFLPRCADSPNDATVQLMSLSNNSPIVGPSSSYNPDMIILDQEIAIENNNRLAKRAKLDAPANAKPKSEDEKKKKPFVTRFSKVVSFDFENPSVAPVLEPITDLRPYINLGGDWIVPALIVNDGPYQIASAKPGWKGKNRAYELIMWDPIFSPMMNAETRKAAKELEDAKTVVLPDAGDIYATIFAPMTTGIEDGSACTDLVLSSGDSMLFGAFDPIRSADKKRSGDQDFSSYTDEADLITRPNKVPIIEDLGDEKTIRANVIKLLQSKPMGASQDALVLALAEYDEDDVAKAITFLLESGDLYGNPENYKA